MLGLLIAGARSTASERESLAKTFIFLPLAISLVGASVIWRFVYAWQPAGQPQYRAPERDLDGVRRSSRSRGCRRSPINIFCEIVILIWLQTGFAMVVLSAAIKGVSAEVIEAARLDGATERQLFLRVIVPMIRGSIITVTTTIAIVTLKIFDIVYVDDRRAVQRRRRGQPHVPARCSSSSTTVAPRRWRPSCSSPCCR